MNSSIVYKEEKIIMYKLYCDTNVIEIVNQHNKAISFIITIKENKQNYRTIRHIFTNTSLLFLYEDIILALINEI